MKNNVLLFFLVLCLILPSNQVEARKGLGSLFELGRGAKAINGVKHYNSGTLTVEQLRSCLLLEKKVDDSEYDLSSKLSLIEIQEQKLKNLEREMSTLKAYLDVNQNAEFYSQQQVDEFNLKVEKYNQFIPVYNIDLDNYKTLESDYNSVVGQHNKFVNDFQTSCAGKLYYEDDLVSAKSGLAN